MYIFNKQNKIFTHINKKQFYNMVSDWGKIKNVRDFNKIKKSIKQSSALWQQNNIRSTSTYPEKYLKLLDLIENAYLENNYRAGNYSKEKMNIQDLNSMDIDIFENVIKLSNIKIVKSPLFKISYIENNELKIISKTVGDFNCDTLNYIKNHQSSMFYIYKITKNYCRWYQSEITDTNYYKELRKEKLKKIEKLSISI